MAEKYMKVIADKIIQAERLMNKSQITKCNIAIHTATAASAAAGVIPIPLADAIPITAAQVTMVIALGKIFDVKLTESAAKGLIGAAASTFVGRNLVKLIPFVGWVVSSAVAAGVTEAIGWTIAVDFAKDAKTRWKEKYNSTEKTYQKYSNFEAQTEGFANEENSTENSEEFIDCLTKRAEAFLSGEKSRADYENDFLDLLTDIEKILDSLPFDHQLRDMYDRLSLIID